MSRLHNVDFSDVEHGVGVLEQHRGDPEEVRRVALLLLQAVDGIAGTAADEFRAVASRCAMFGDGVELVRPALYALAVACAGWSGAQSFDQQRRARAADHGKLGGRPRDDHGAEWLRLFNAHKAKNPRQSAADVYRRIAADWRDEHDRARSWTTVRNAVAAEKKRNALKKVDRKPPFSR